MAYVFVLIFFAAVAGLIKPYIKGLKRSHFAIAAVVAFVLVGVTTPTTPGSKARADGNTAQAATADANDANSASAADSGDTTAETTSNWDYHTSKDEMRGTSARMARVTSDNSVDLDFPYGEIHGQLWIRQRPEDGLNVAFEVEKGQILCNSFDESYISIKFDNGPVQKFRCTEASDGSDNVAFFDNEHRVLAELEKSKRAIVEAEFYQQGRKQFTFETGGLNWK